MKIKKEVEDAIEEFGDVIAHEIQKVPPQHASILPSEMLAFCCLAFKRNVKFVLESGRKYGYSTDVLSRFNWTVTSLEVDPDPEYDKKFSNSNVTLVRADGERYIKDAKTDLESALLCDGPKGVLALGVCNSVRGRYEVMAIHDAHPGSQLRDAVKETAYLTDNESLVSKFGYLDFPTLDHRGHKDHDELLSCANVLAILP